MTYTNGQDPLELAVRGLVSAIREQLAPSPEPTPLVDIATAARLLGISRTSLYALMDEGHLAYRHVGRRRLVPRAAIEAFAEGGQR